MPATSALLRFDAAVERPLSVVFRTPDGRWEGHDYRVEVVTTRQGLDACDVVVDFRDLEAVLVQELTPLQGRLLSDLGFEGPLALMRHLLAVLAPTVPAPAVLREIAFTDGQGRRMSLQA